jgi:hypothetical protein
METSGKFCQNWWCQMVGFVGFLERLFCNGVGYGGSEGWFQVGEGVQWGVARCGLIRVFS